MDGQQVVYKALNKIIEREIGAENADKITSMLLKLDHAELSKLCSNADLMLSKIAECQSKIASSEN